MWGAQHARSVFAVAGLALALAATGCSSDGGDGADPAPSTTAVGPVSTAPPSSDPGAATSEGELRVLAYNVAGLPVEISSERPDVNLPKISPLLAEFDLVLTQEDFDHWKPDGLASTRDFINYHDRLWAEAGQPHQTPVHPGFEAVGMAERPNVELGDGLAVGSQFPLGETVRVPWAGCFGGFDTSDGGAADCLAIKGFLHTRITVADGVEIDIYNLHAEAGGTAEDQRLQVEDFQQLAAHIAANSEGRAIILGGDTNLHTDPPGPDGHPDGSNGADLDIWTTFLEAAGLTDACSATGCDGPGRIDKFAFRSGGGVTLEARSHRFLSDVFVDDAGEALSDHEALEVVFAWTLA